MPMGYGNRESSSCTITENPPGLICVIFPGTQPPAQFAWTLSPTAKVVAFAWTEAGAFICIGCGIGRGLCRPERETIPMIVSPTINTMIVPTTENPTIAGVVLNHGFAWTSSKDESS